ncbi:MULTISPECIES: 4-hydroxy-tetrahydrodipicolinate reductase [Rothia]|uniref:4-hydroxy-tetrahydrodipicolinate reductase n=1 Tax=Rothia nasimurium TaxID=85336 RepID=A0A1Y1RNG9_9MICC|nr:MULTISPECIES: 4-hydroxy-tetrahydrodipicolinate reductase [Rothia]ORC15566.1 4-hydroxy-tetrahydrodipicolinate reductase [Rothia nasimurium]
MSKIWKVAVVGAAGRMGSEAVKAVNAAEDMDLVAALGNGDSLDLLVEYGAEVMVDLTVPAATETNVSFAVENGIHAVVGTTGWSDERLAVLREQLEQHPRVGVLIAPNFAIGSILATEFAAQAAKFFESVEVIEMHHPNKVDAPSGTAVHTAKKIAAARAEAGVGASPDATETDEGGSRGAKVEGVNVHAVRLRGLTAHQEILLGDAGQQLVIRHDSFDRTSFMPGVLLGVRKVAEHPGLTVGLDRYLNLF